MMGEKVDIAIQPPAYDSVVSSVKSDATAKKPVTLSAKMGQKKFWVEEMLIYPKLLFFFLLFAINACYTYRTKFFEDVYGIPAKHYGLIAASLSFVAFCCAPLWTYVADRFRRPKLVLLVASMIEGAGFQLFLTVPKRQGNLTFGLIIAVGAVINCFNAALYPLMDRVCLLMLGTKNRDSYGMQRLWGSLGNMAITALVGFLASKDMYGYDALYFAVAITQLLFFVIGYAIIPSDKLLNKHESDELLAEEVTNEEASESEAKKTSSESLTIEEAPKKMKKSEHLKVLLCNKVFLFYLMIALINGLCKAIGSHFMSHFIEDTKIGLGASKPLVALSQNCANLMEIIFFFVSPIISKKFGLLPLLMIAQISMAIRMAIHSFLPVGGSHDWAIGLACFAEAIKGASFGSMTSSGVLLSAREAPKEVQATAQGIFSGVFIGLAPCLAGILGFILIREDGSPGHWYENHQGLFRLALGLSFLSFFLLCIRYAYYEKKEPPKTK